MDVVIVIFFQLFPLSPAQTDLSAGTVYYTTGVSNTIILIQTLPFDRAIRTANRKNFQLIRSCRTITVYRIALTCIIGNRISILPDDISTAIVLIDIL